MNTAQKYELAKRLLLSFEEYVKWIHPIAQGCEYDMTPAHVLLCSKLQEYAECKNTKRNLLINCPPGTGKSLLLQYFITWCFARNKHCMFCYIAYGERLIKKLSRESRNLMMSPEWEELFGKEMDPGDKSVLNYHLLSGGVRSGLTAGTVSSAVLGLDAANPASPQRFSGALLCFPYSAKILTSEGERKIGDIVRKRDKVLVACSGGWGEVVDWQCNPGSEMVEVFYEGGSVRCTPDHRIYTKDGWKRADGLQPGDIIIGAQTGLFASSNSFDLGKAKAVLGAGDVSWKRFNVTDNAFGNFQHMFWLNSSNGRELSAGHDIIKECSVNSEKLALSCCDFDELGSGKGSMCQSKVLNRVGHVLDSGSIFKVLGAVIARVIVLVTNVVSFWTRANKSSGDCDMNEQAFINAVNSRGTKKVADTAIVWPGSGFKQVLRHYLSRKLVTAEAITNGVLLGIRIRPALDTPEVRREVVGVIGDWFPDFTIQCKSNVLFNASCIFSHSRVLSVKKCKRADRTYCLTVKKYHTFLAKSSGAFMPIVSNCDDINSPEVRTSVHEQIEVPETYQRKLATRRRTPWCPTICIQQRLHPADFSGWILKNEPEEWETVIIPALDEAGESFYPKRYPKEEMERIQKQNPYLFAAMYQQKPLENYGAYFHEEWIKTYRATPEKFQKVFITTDFGMSANKGDKSLFTCWGLGSDNNLYLLRSRMGKWEVPDAKKQCIDFFNHCRAAFRQCRRVYVENTLSGIGFIQEMRRECPEMAIVPLRRGAKKNKMNRVDSAMTWLEAGRIYFREADPNFVPLRAELLAWSPSDKNPTDEICDCMGDAAEIAFNMKTGSIFV